MKRILLNESGTLKINIVFCAELSETNCRAELSAPNCPGTSRETWSDLITEVFKSRTKLRLENKEKNFKFNAGSEGTLMKL